MFNNSRIIRSSEILELLQKSGFTPKLRNFTDIDIKNIATDSRKVKPGTLFICITGFQTDGHKFVNSAYKAGVKMLIVERFLSNTIPQIKVTNSRKAAAIIAKFYFQNPTNAFKLIGVTGTNGKTTICDIIFQLLKQQSYSVGKIGTLGYQINEKHFPTNHTTPDIINLNQILNKMKQHNVDYVVMEVSSHAIQLNRIYGLEFDLALLSNITQDHLDFHKNMNSYAETKLSFLKNVLKQKKKVIVNADDVFGNNFSRIYSQVYTLSFTSGDFVIKEPTYSFEGSSFNFLGQKFETKLIGKHNVFNIAAAIAALVNINSNIVTPQMIKNLKNIRGRLERASIQKQIFIDYAHTPAALENVLTTLYKLKRNWIITVFGAGGNRDVGKRPKMLNAALKYSDLCIITSDNPRWEEPMQIIRDITSQASYNEKFWILPNRKMAIKTAVAIAKKEDIVLIAGKGHETSQQIKGKKIYFDDKKVAENSWQPPLDKLSLPIHSLMLEKIFDTPPLPNNLITNISTDSRQIKENSLFFALKGENFDAHNFVEDVLDVKGCLAIVKKDFPKNDPRLIKVDSPLLALGKLAKKYLQLFSLVKIALTGSVGKTTCKEFIYNILSEVASTQKTSANENNQIGLPKTIFNLHPQTKYAILEIGTNHFGEIAYLTDIVEPDIGIITKIGPTHLEFFHDVKGVFQEKADLMKFPLKIRIFPGDDGWFQNFEGITFGKKSDNDFQIREIKQLGLFTNFKLNDKKYTINSPFFIHAYNAAIAIILAKTLKVSEKHIIKGLEKPIDIKYRMQIINRNNQIYLADCYNANPDSMKAALKFWLNYQPHRPHVAILGDMLELGKHAKKMHKEISEFLQNEKFDSLISVGKYASLYDADKHFKTVDDFLEAKIDFPSNAIILLKGSHSIALEKIVERK
ncbi:MAG: UDP-N-acetylmuramoyl-L-alanyl-D-glutamate--2,6-diaminopimelate ligase [Candidatus Cloacimonadota bacterium]|nr:UDP-N-acetylmuramoyl-L-alanyl-D-glutamate--2,6-diaminopimelate ligase [Candidatus Cloacimonadota bacterium]